MVQIAGRKVGRGGDVAHAGRGKAARATNAGGGLQNVDAARVGAA
jgi:hypothetical protein